MSSTWKQNEKLVIETLDRLEKKVDVIQTDVQAMKTDLATHKVKSGLWGAISGIVMAWGYKMFGGG